MKVPAYSVWPVDSIVRPGRRLTLSGPFISVHNINAISVGDEVTGAVQTLTQSVLRTEVTSRDAST